MEDEIVAALARQVKFCVWCKVWYTELGNVGTWLCDFHPKSFNRDEKGENHAKGRWDCCGRAEQMQGCVPCDHRNEDVYWEEDNSIEIDATAALKIGVPKKAMRRSENFTTLPDGTLVSKVIVDRFDPESFHSHVLYSVPPGSERFDPLLQSYVTYVAIPGKGVELMVTPK